MQAAGKITSPRSHFFNIDFFQDNCSQLGSFQLLTLDRIQRRQKDLRWTLDFKVTDNILNIISLYFVIILCFTHTKAHPHPREHTQIHTHTQLGGCLVCQSFFLPLTESGTTLVTRKLQPSPCLHPLHTAWVTRGYTQVHLAILWMLWFEPKSPCLHTKHSCPLSHLPNPSL